MPRGVPSYKSGELDQIPLKFTSFFVPAVAPLSSKIGTSNYLRSEQQSIFTRPDPTIRRKYPGDIQFEHTEGPRGSNVIVIHPGSRFLRIGKGSDSTPLTVPHVIARKSDIRHGPAAPSPTSHHEIRMNRIAAAENAHKLQPFHGPVNWSNPFDPAILLHESGKQLSILRTHMKGRLQMLKLRLPPEGQNMTFEYNRFAEPMPIEEVNDSYNINWTVPDPHEHFLVGQRALDLPDPRAQGFSLRWPFKGSNFNYSDYSDTYSLLNDVETIWIDVLTNQLQIPRRAFKDHSVMLVVPDFYDVRYIRDLVNALITGMGFKEVCLQQESLCIAYGAGLPTACMVDLGAQKISITCVDDGVLNDGTCMNLAYGGDDVTSMLNDLIERCHFPYLEIDPMRWYDWQLLEDLKAKVCHLNESEVASNLHDIVVRRPGVPPLKYRFRLFDEVILAPSTLFEPRVLDWDKRPSIKNKLWNPDCDMGDLDRIPPSSAMSGSTSHITLGAQRQQQQQQQQQIQQPPTQQLMQQQPIQQPLPPPPPPPPAPVPPPHFTLPPQGTQLVWKPPILAELGGIPQPSTPGQPAGLNAVIRPPLPPMAGNVIQNQPGLSRPQHPPPIQISFQQEPYVTSVAPPSPPDVPWEASRIPMDIAIFNCTRAAGSAEKSKKYLSSVLVVGGTSLIKGLVPALESRLQILAQRYLPNVESSKVQVITPRDCDPRIVAWRGAALYSKLESVSDLWIKKSEWETLGTRALWNRTLFLAAPKDKDKNDREKM